MPYITFKEQSRQVGPGVLTIGGGHEASWRIPGYDLAPLHAVVAPERDGQAVIMRGSPFATVLINGTAMDTQSRRLEFGDVIKLGAAELRYVESNREDVGSEGFLNDVRHNRVFKLLDHNTIGRELKCNVLLHDATTSRIHADIRNEGGRFILTPSGGVTFVNGRHIAEPVALKDGDEIGVGRTVLRFSREMPSYALEVKAPSSGRNSYADVRASKVQTTFMGVVEQRELQQRQRSRQLGKVAAVVISAALVISALASAIYGHKGGAAGQKAAAARTSNAAAGSVARPAAASTTTPVTDSSAAAARTPADSVSPAAATAPRR